MKTLYFALALLVTGALASGPTVAAPAGPATNKPVIECLATPVASYRCRRDDRGWHSMRGERRVTCRPARPDRNRMWGWNCQGPRCGWWHSRDRRWHDRD